MLWFALVNNPETFGTDARCTFEPFCVGEHDRLLDAYKETNDRGLIASGYWDEEDMAIYFQYFIDEMLEKKNIHVRVYDGRIEYEEGDLCNTSQSTDTDLLP